MSALYCLLVISTMAVGIQAHTYHDGYDRDAYIDEDSNMISVRECTECHEDYPSCPVTYLDIVNGFYGTNRWWNGNLDPSPLDIANVIYVTCLEDELAETGDRKKRTVPLTHKGALRRTTSRRKRGDHYRFNDDARGLIYINRMYFGRKRNGMDCDDMHTSSDRCHMNGFNEWDMEHFVDCNGAYDCADAAIPTALQDCNAVSDFLHIDYQCINERNNYYMEYEEHTGDYRGREADDTGYVMSPNYPHKYPNYQAVQCDLHLDARTGSFQFTLLDFHLEDGSDGHGCIYDWVELQSYIGGEMHQRRRFCGEHEPGYLTTVYADDVTLKFRSDHNVKHRGFWIKYQGFTLSGQSADVSTDCHFYDPREDGHYDDMDPDYYWDYYDYSSSPDWSYWMPTKEPVTDDSREGQGPDDNSDEGDDDDDSQDDEGRAERRRSGGDDAGLDSQTIIIIAASVGGFLVLLIIIIVSVVICKRRKAAPPKTPSALEGKLKRETKAKPDNSRKSENPYTMPAYTPQPQQGIYTLPFDNPGYQSNPSDQKLSVRTGPLPSAPVVNEEIYEAISDTGMYQYSGTAGNNPSNGVSNPGYDSEVPIRTMQHGANETPQATTNPPVYSETYEDMTSQRPAKSDDNAKKVTSTKPVQRMPTYQNTNENAYDVIGSAGVHGAPQETKAALLQPYLSIEGDDASSNYYLQPVSANK